MRIESPCSCGQSAKLVCFASRHYDIRPTRHECTVRDGERFSQYTASSRSSVGGTQALLC